MNRLKYGILLYSLLTGICLAGAVFRTRRRGAGPIIREIVFNGLQHISR